MERLWSPWRMSYVAGSKREGCVFCEALRSQDEPRTLVLHRGVHAFLMLNLYPYNSGHMMAAPNAHAASILDIDAETRAEIFDLATLAVEGAQRVLRCDGFNLGMNLGEVAGAGIADHLHLHIVPRWTGDANFMPILGNTMVMPEMLPATWARLRAELETVVARRRGETTQAGALVALPDRGRVALRISANGQVVVPKGHIEPGESAADAAIRELREETGLTASIVGWAGSLGFQAPASADAHERRHVVYFIATGHETDDTIARLGRDVVLAPVAEAAAMIEIPDLRDLVARAAPELARLSGTAQ